MPNWKKVITSGSDAALNSLNVTSAFTASGITYPTSDGSNNQSLITDGAGNLTFGNPYSDNTVVYGKNLSGTTIEKGTPLYFTGSGTAGNLVGVFPADASNPARMPAGGIAGEQLLNEAEGVILLDGFINGVDTSTFSSGDLVYVGVGGGYTNVAPTGSSNLIQALGYVERVSDTNGSGVIKGPGVFRSVPNIQQGYIWVGNADDVATPATTSSLRVANADTLDDLNSSDFVRKTGDVDESIDGEKHFGTKVKIGGNSTVATEVLAVNSTTAGGTTVGTFTNATMTDTSSPANSVYGGVTRGIYTGASTIGSIIGQNNIGRYTGTGAASFIIGADNRADYNSTSTSNIGTMVSSYNLGSISNTGTSTIDLAYNNFSNLSVSNPNININWLASNYSALTLTSGSFTNVILNYLNLQGSISGTDPNVNIENLYYILANDTETYTTSGESYFIKSTVPLPSTLAGDLILTNNGSLNISGNITGSTAQLTSIPSGTSETNVVLTDGSGNLVTRSASSLSVASASFASTSSFLDSTTNAFIQNGNSFGTTATLGTNDNQSLAFETNGTTKMFVSSSGNVGIGTTTPASNLHIKTSVDNSVAQGLIIERSANSDKGYINYNGGGFQFRSTVGDPIVFGETDAEHMRITSDGNVGIGTTNPSEKLEVNGNIKADSFIKDGGTSNQFLKADGSVDTISYASTDNTYNKLESDSIFTSKTLSQNISFGESYASNYRSRVLDYGGTFFPRPLGYEIGLMKEQELFQKASLSLLPSGVGTGKVHNIKPKNDTFDFTRASTATYVDEDGLIQMAATNVPRLNYPLIDGVVSGCPSLLLEPSRSNLALYSEQFDNAAWGKYNISVTANTATAPDNTVSADKIIPSTSADGHHLTETVTGAAHSFSVFAKSGGYSTLNILYTVHNSYATFNLSDGTITETNGTATAKIENYGNGWYRCTVSTSSTTHTEVRIYAINGTTFADVNTPGNGTDGILVWGAQLEVGSYATSYIPTLAAASTRGADASFKTGISSLIGQTEGTMFAEFTIPETQSPSFFSISDGTSANRIIFGYYLGVVRYYTSSTTGSFSSAGIIDAAPVVGQTYKIAIGYKANDFKVYKNGSNTNTETTYTVPESLTALDNEGGDAGQNIYAGVKQLLLFPTRLTNTQLAELTTL